jgi:hypothetical protein
MKLNYPTWKMKGSPTPNETLYCCDKCGDCRWYPLGFSTIMHCFFCKGKKGGFVRMRQATEKEKQEALKVLKTIIG